jgi:hypothetical protein
VVSLVLVVAGFYGAFRGLRGDLTRFGEAGR